MNKTLKYLGLLVLLPLFTVALTTNFVNDADAIKSKGRTTDQYGSKTASIVCGDRLCSEYPGGYEQFQKDQGQSSKIGDEAITPKIAEEKEVTMEESVMIK